VILLALLAQPAAALIFLPENSLESMLVRADAVVIATITQASEATNRGTAKVDDTLKGKAEGTINLNEIMLRVTRTERKPRFAAGDRVVLFLGPAVDDVRTVLHSETLKNDAEVNTMKGCILEVQPFAAVLADLGLKKPIDEKGLREALTKLTSSKNGYSQILVGRIIGTHLTQRLPPAGWEDVLLPALQSKRRELVQGALKWTAKYERIPPAARATLQAIAANKEEPALAKEARGLLDRVEAPTTRNQ